jgi:hypothetical protein
MESEMQKIAGMKTFFLKFVTVLAVVSVIGLPILLHGQAISGDLLGVVTDSTGAVVSGAQVVATNFGTGVKSTTKTNATIRSTRISVHSSSARRRRSATRNCPRFPV